MFASTLILLPRVRSAICSESSTNSLLLVYSKDMPERLPILLVMRQFSRQIVSAILFGLRAALVATVWLAALPWSTIWTWRMYFALGNSA